MKREAITKILIVCAVIILTPLYAYAASEGHESSFSDLIPYWVNFLLYLAILYKFLAKPVSQGWASRAATIESAVSRGVTERAQAQKLLDEAVARKNLLSKELRELEEEIHHQQEHESLEIINDGIERASRVNAQAQDMMKAEQKAFEASLRKDLSEEVLKKAKAILSQKLDAQSDRKLREEAVQGIPQLLN